MFEHIKRRVVKELISEILCISAADLEIVGHNVVGIREGQRLIHRGINKDHKPVGYTVDSFSEDSSIVSEYSTEQGYFKERDTSGHKGSPAYPKIEKDIQHALHHKEPDGPEKIYLITNQEEPPAFRARFNATSTGKTYGGRIVLLDARELAIEIYQQSVENAEYAGAYKQFFPGFSQNLDNFEYYGKLPAPCEGHVPDQGIRNALATHFLGQQICILHGVSGSGKTQAAIDYVRYHAGEFQNYLWISGEDWHKDTSLSAIQRSRGGAPINIAGLFNSSTTVLVIDSLERGIDLAAFDELSIGFAKGGIVIVTSQSAILEKDKCLPVPELSIETATQILGENWGTASERAQRFIEACRFCPLILSMARVIIDQQQVPSDNLYSEILASPETIVGRDGQSIINKILSHLDDSSLKALKKIANSGETIYDLDFLRDFVGIANSHKLQQLSILLPTSNPGVVKIHDLVCIAACDTVDGRELATAIENYVQKYSGDMTPSVLRQLHLGYKQVSEEHIQRGIRDPDWLTYGLLQVEGEIKQELHDQIYASKITYGLSLASVMCIIEAKEVHSYTIENSEQRKHYFGQCAEEFREAFSESTDEEIRSELLHHRGKALRRCGRYEDALECFTSLLESRPQWHATHAQIAHLGIQKGAAKHIRERGEESMRILTQSIMQDASSVPLRVSLAAIARLRSYRDVANEISSEPDSVRKLADIIAVSALEGFGQFYEAFVSFTSIFGYNHNSFCVALAENFPEMLALPPTSVEKTHWVSACEALANTATAAGRAEKPGLAATLTGTSIGFADAISKSSKLKPYDARAVAKTYILAGLPEKALDAIAKVADADSDHWLLYQKVRALLAIGNLESALKHAERAWELAGEDESGRQRIATYHDLLSQCYEASGEKETALAQIKLALENCTDDQYRKTLAERASFLDCG